jgi:putative membrane protein
MSKENFKTISAIPMKRLQTTLALVAVGALLLTGCAKKSETTYTDSANTTTSTGTTPAPNDTSHGATSASTPAPPEQGNLTDANIVAMLIEADSGEVAQGKLVASKTKNAAVKGFANEMVKDHTKLKSETEALAKKLNLTPQPPANDPNPSDLTQWMSTLGSTTDPNALDSVYMNHMVEDHSKDVQDVTEMQSKAQSPDLKSAIDKALPILKKHLTDAQAVVKKLEAKGTAKNTTAKK